MKKLPYIVGLIIVAIVAVLFYASVLGENRRIDLVVDGYFKLVKEGKYEEACRAFGSGELLSTDNNKTCNSEYIFAIELALLKHFDLSMYEKYRVKLEANKFWFPFVSDGNVEVGVKLVPHDKKFVYFSDSATDYIDSFISIKRIDGQWKIAGFDVNNEAIKDNFKKISEKVVVSNYITAENNTIRLHEISVNKDKISEVDTKIISFIMRKFESMLVSNDNKVREIGGRPNSVRHTF